MRPESFCSLTTMVVVRPSAPTLSSIVCSARGVAARTSSPTNGPVRVGPTSASGRNWALSNVQVVFRPGCTVIVTLREGTFAVTPPPETHWMPTSSQGGVPPGRPWVNVRVVPARTPSKVIEFAKSGSASSSRVKPVAAPESV